jgi:hypothetical protein
MPTPATRDGRPYNLQDSYREHAEAMDEARDALAALSDGPVIWEHGRGWSGIARVPDAVYQHRWSSAHEAAVDIAGLALDMLVWPLEGITDPQEQWEVARERLARCWKALAIPMDEEAALCERIRRERAKLLRQAGLGVKAAEGMEPGRVPTEPRKLLIGWHAITAAVEMKYSQREDVKSLNKRFNGPIRHQGQGTSPMVCRDDLLEWWNKLAIQQQDLANQREGAILSGETQYDFGRDGTVAPEIAGSVKKRRKGKGSPSEQRT